MVGGVERVRCFVPGLDRLSKSARILAGQPERTFEVPCGILPRVDKRFSWNRKLRQRKRDQVAQDRRIALHLNPAPAELEILGRDRISSDRHHPKRWGIHEYKYQKPCIDAQSTQ